MPRKLVSTRVSGVVVLVLCAACQGVIADGPSSMELEPDPDPIAVGGSEVRSSSGIRVLTAEQWRRSVQVVLGDRADVSATLPSPESAHGFRNVGGTAVPPAEIDAYVTGYWAASQQAVESAFGDGMEWTGCSVDAEPSDPCVEEFLLRTGRRAWRRPLTAEELRRTRHIAEMVFAREGSLASALGATTQALLMSPHFTYLVSLPTAGADGEWIYSSFAVASRLSFLLQNRSPDDALLDAAAAGELDTSEGLSDAVGRILETSEGEAGALAFFREYLGFEAVATFDGAPPGLSQAMSREADAMVRDVLFTSREDMRSIFNWEFSYVDAPLAAHYNVDFNTAGDGTTLSRVPSPDGRRGYLGTGAFLTGRHGIFRGVLLVENLLCTSLGPPPQDEEDAESPPGPEDDDPDRPRTQRQRFEELTSAPKCVGCHQKINRVGFVLEDYDETARFRDQDNGLPIDTRGKVLDTDVASLEELAGVLAASPVVGRCMIDHLHRYAVGSLPGEGDAADLDALMEDVERQGPLTLQAVLMAYVTHPVFLEAGTLR
ncbi:MAG: DUF1592 domain-containing protein [Myxococcota bacterium]